MSSILNLISDFYKQIKDYARAVDIKNRFELFSKTLDLCSYNLDDDSRKDLINSKYVILTKDIEELNKILKSYKNKGSLLEEKIKNIRDELVEESIRIFLLR
ncbi:MAG: hypothetical protein QXU20_04485 [Candidatus Woesearchaeota archaeon]